VIPITKTREGLLAAAAEINVVTVISFLAVKVVRETQIFNTFVETPDEVRNDFVANFVACAA
jgi:hypothetical protein